MTENSDFEAGIYATIRNRIFPLLFISFILAYLDRVNVGFAKLQMQHDLRMSDTVYGLGAGIFFIGYFLFEVPANMAMRRIGARRWLGSILILVGAISAATLSARTALEFYALRFVLGVAESGFFPGAILYLTFWHSRAYRGRATAAFMLGIPVSGVVGGPLSGSILAGMSRLGGLHGWQWLYLLEGVPTVLAGIAFMYLMADGPGEVGWLTAEQKRLLASRLAEEQSGASEGKRLNTLLDAFRSPMVWIFSGVFFGFVMGIYGIGFWLPQIISDTITPSTGWIGLLTAIPWIIGATAMLLIARHSDATGERRWHITVAGVIGAAAFAASAIPGVPGWFSLAALTVAAAGVLGAVPIFWCLPTAILSSTAAAAGIAWINSVGNLAGYVGPFVIGKLVDAQHNMTLPLLMLSGASLAAAAAVACMKPKEPGVRNAELAASGDRSGR